jgi:hypothetical protein
MPNALVRANEAIRTLVPGGVILTVDRFSDPDMLTAGRLVGEGGFVIDALVSPRTAAAELKMSVATLTGHAKDGEIRYISVGRGKKNVRRMYRRSDIEEFKQRRARRDAPCLSISQQSRRTTTMTSKLVGSGFMARRNAQLAEKPNGLRQ